MSHTPLSRVGQLFTEVYHTILNTKLSSLINFYNESSTFISGSESRKEESVQGLERIKAKIAEFSNGYVKVVTLLDCQESIEGSLVVLTSGLWVNHEGESKRFVETFVLVPQKPNGYYVHNAIFRLLENSVPFTEPSESTDHEFKQVESSTESNVAPTDTAAIATAAAVAAVASDQLSPTAPVTNDPSPNPGDDHQPDNQAHPEGESTSATKEVFDASIPAMQHELASLPVTTPPNTASAILTAISPNTSTVGAESKPVGPRSWAKIAGSTPTVSTNTKSPPTTTVKIPTQTPAHPSHTSQPKPSQQIHKQQSQQQQQQPQPPQQLQTQQQQQITNDHRPDSIFVGSLPESAVPERLRALFSPFGSVKDVNLKAEKHYAFVKFAHPDSVAALMARHEPIKYDERELNIEPKRDRPQNSGSGVGNKDRGSRGSFNSASAKQHGTTRGGR